MPQAYVLSQSDLQRVSRAVRAIERLEPADKTAQQPQSNVYLVVAASQINTGSSGLCNIQRWFSGFDFWVQTDPLRQITVHNRSNRNIGAGHWLIAHREYQTGQWVAAWLDIEFAPFSSFDILSAEPSLVTSGGTTIPFDTYDNSITTSATYIPLTATAGEIQLNVTGTVEIYSQVIARNSIDSNFYKWQIWLQRWRSSTGWRHVNDSVAVGLTDGGSEGEVLQFTRLLEVLAGDKIRVRGMQLNGSSGGVTLVSQLQPTIDSATLHYGSKLIVKYLTYYL